MIGRRQLMVGAAALAAAPVARASQTITVLSGAEPGSPMDRQMRVFLPLLLRHLPDVVCAPRIVLGGGGVAALQELAKAPTDGTVLGWVGTPALPARAVEDRGAASVVQEVALLGAVEQEPIAIVAPAATHFGSAEDIIEQASQNPGGFPIGTPPSGSAPHLAALRLQALTETKLHIVTFPSAAAACQATVAGKVTAAVLGLSSAITDLRSGGLEGLGIAAANSADAFPDMPSLLDSGIDLSAAIRRGLAGPAGLPDDFVRRLARAMEAVTDDPEFQGQADKYGFVAAWMDGSLWTAEAHNEQVELAKLWASGPWLPRAQG